MRFICDLLVYISDVGPPALSAKFVPMLGGISVYDHDMHDN